MPPEPFVPPPDEYEDVEDDTIVDTEADDPTPDATDAADYNRRRKSKDVQVQNIADFWRRTMENQVGRAAMWELLSTMHTFEVQFATGPNGFPQPEATWFKAGEQATGTRIFQSMQRHNFEGTHRMLLEHHPDFKPRPKPKRRKKPDG